MGRIAQVGQYLFCPFKVATSFRSGLSEWRCIDLAVGVVDQF
jgi:hypothetical protein